MTDNVIVALHFFQTRLFFYRHIKLGLTLLNSQIPHCVEYINVHQINVIVTIHSTTTLNNGSLFLSVLQKH